MTNLEDKISQKFERLFIHRESLDSILARRLIPFFPEHQISVVDQRPFFDDHRRLSREEFETSKKNLFLTKFKGRFFKRCPGSKPGLACCNYFVLNWGLQCDFNCSYCYLQSFLNTPVTTLYTNLEEALHELEQLSETMADSSLRVGTGEVVDSLSLDPLTRHSIDLITFFRRFPKWQLEFKTKSNYVDQFLETPHAGNVIVSWSINSNFIIEHEEHLTARLNDRFSAARKCLNKGFKVAFHIDPLIWHNNWKKEYGELIDLLTAQFRPDEISYISLGALRYQKDQRHLMRERFGSTSWSLRGEMFPSEDGKLRYDKELRNEMFNYLMDCFKTQSKTWKIFLCMETPETWISTTGELPQKQDALNVLFSPSVIQQVRKAQSDSLY